MKPNHSFFFSLNRHLGLWSLLVAISENLCVCLFVSLLFKILTNFQSLNLRQLNVEILRKCLEIVIAVYAIYDITNDILLLGSRSFRVSYNQFI